MLTWFSARTGSRPVPFRNGPRELAMVPAVAAAVTVVFAAPVAAVAADGPAADGPSERFAVHGQLTYVEQGTSSFNAPYRGPNSLSPDQVEETFDATAFVGAELWPGAEAWVNLEVDQGFGLDNTLGVAGFPNGEAYKVGSQQPYFRIPRALIRQTLDLDQEREPVDSAANQLGGVRSPNRVVMTLGKFGAGDVFDTNIYAHDPRSDFLNWTAIDAGSFDYAADAWGYTVGAAVEWYQGPWTLRGGLFALSDLPNSEHLDLGGHQFQMVLELERRHDLGGLPGRLLVTAYDSRARMGLLDEAVDIAESTGEPVDIAAIRHYRSRLGVHVGLEQQISADLGTFARAGAASGNVEAYEFTDVDSTVEGGFSLKGTSWNRARDTAALAMMVNDISAARRRFLDAGGLGLLVGDGKLPNSGSEQILETYYSLNVLPASLFVAADYQWINHPAYNRDRGPVSVVALRVHAQF